ncbi:MAG: deoxynucleoside kinase [Mariprofundaceae bacterium]|nr:deoxynucleoside kinase [Mariprofundaceae bacterium]
MQDLHLKHIAIEGPVGIGKTTLARALADKLQADVLLERIDDNPFIGLFYEDTTRHALPVQLSFLFSRLKQWQALHQQQLFQQGLITDYIFAKDRLFATVTLSDAELALYDQVLRAVAVDLPRPDLVIYLQSDAGVIMQRIKKRNRSFEQNLGNDYLKRIIAAYDQFFFHYQETPLLIVQTDKLNFAENPDDIDALLSRIATMRSGTEFWADYTG